MSTIADNLVEHNGRNGIYVDVAERSSGTVIQTLTVYNNTASFNGSNGIRSACSDHSGGSVSQTALLTDNLVLSNGAPASISTSIQQRRHPEPGHRHRSEHDQRQSGRRHPDSQPPL